MHFASYYRWLVYQHLFPLPATSAALLDIGSDDGGFIERLPVRLSVALDRAVASLRRARADLRVCADGTHLPFRDAQFDFVVLSDVVEHVENDATLIADAANRVKLHGTLWLSTTAAQFTLFPSLLTARAERSWGHVRKGYTTEQLHAYIGPNFVSEVVVWPEIALRHSYALLWICSKWLPQLARMLVYACFLIDVRLRTIQKQQGHIYIRAIRQD